MSRKRRLHYKDLDAMRFLAFLPVFLFCALFLMSTEDNPFISDLAILAGYGKQNSIDFFFFLSSFLLTSHALRELKYKKKFAFKSFYIRRMMRIFPLFVLAIVFAFVLHPYVVNILSFEPIDTPDFFRFFTAPPEFPSALTKEQYIYLAVIWTIYMFIQFYLVWGVILKFFLQQIKYVSYGIIALGIADRILHILNGSSFEFDVLSAGIPIGIGALTANIIRNDERTIELIKHLNKVTHGLAYLIGVATILFGYTYLSGRYFELLIPIVTGLFFGYAVTEQTFGKHSIIKLHKYNLITKLGKISYGLLIYSSIILVLGIISVDSLNLNLSSIPIQVGYIVLSLFITWIVADVSYNLLERPIYAIRKEFKRS